MKTNKFIENSTKELLDRLKESFEKYNKLREELTILNSYKTIFGID